MTPHARHGPPRGFRQDWEAWSTTERILIPLVSGVVLILLSLGLLWLFVSGSEEAGRKDEELTRCLKAATNGYEIRECERRR